MILSREDLKDLAFVASIISAAGLIPLASESLSPQAAPPVNPLSPPTPQPPPVTPYHGGWTTEDQRRLQEFESYQRQENLRNQQAQQQHEAWLRSQALTQDITVEIDRDISKPGQPGVLRIIRNSQNIEQYPVITARPTMQPQDDDWSVAQENPQKQLLIKNFIVPIMDDKFADAQGFGAVFRDVYPGFDSAMFSIKSLRQFSPGTVFKSVGLFHSMIDDPTSPTHYINLVIQPPGAYEQLRYNMMQARIDIQNPIVPRSVTLNISGEQSAQFSSIINTELHRIKRSGKNGIPVFFKRG